MSRHSWNSRKPRPVFSLKETTVLRVGVYLVDVLDEAHGYTFIADTYSGSDGNQPGVIDVKIRIVGINVMFLLLHLIMYATFGPIVLSGFTLICFSLLPLFLRQCRLRGGAVRMCLIQVWRSL